MTLAQWQAKGEDAGTVAKAYPDDSIILDQVKQTLLMQ